MNQTSENRKKPSFGSILFHIWATKFYFQNLALSVTRYHGQLSSYTISEKNNNSIFRKLSDRWMDGQTDGRGRVIS